MTQLLSSAMTTANNVSAPVAAARPRHTHAALTPRYRATARLGRERSSGVRHDTTSLRRRAVTRTRGVVADVEDEELSEEDEERRRFFAAATGLFSPAVLSSPSGKHGPCCLLSPSDEEGDSEDAFNVNGGGGDGGGGRKALGNRILALALGVAGFGTVGGGRSLLMEQAAHAASTSLSSVSVSASASSSRAYYSKYSNSLLPAAVTTSGAARTHSDHIGFVPNPHFEDMICSRWFVGSMNALG